MPTRPKLLVLDDDPDMLEICQELLQLLPGRPEIRTAASGPHALRMLEAEPFAMLVTDLSMPGMDGVQVLAVVRRKWPQLRTVVITSTLDEELRRRAHGIGVDFFCEKPRTSKEVEAFLAALQGLLKDEGKPVACPAQERSLAELLHLECLARNSCVIKCAHGGQEGRIWIHRGEIVDATLGDVGGQAALDNIVSWQDAKCELLPGEPGRPQRIRGVRPAARAPAEPRRPSLAGEREAAPAWRAPGVSSAGAETAPERPPLALAELARAEGAQLALGVQPGEPEPKLESWRVEHAKELGQWTITTLQLLGALGGTLRAGEIDRVEAVGSAGRLFLACKGKAGLCLGFGRGATPEQARQSLKSVVSQWAS